MSDGDVKNVYFKKYKKMQYSSGFFKNVLQYEMKRYFSEAKYVDEEYDRYKSISYMSALKKISFFLTRRFSMI